MAAVVVNSCSASRLKYKNIFGLVGHLKNDGVVKVESIRYHHISPNICRTHIVQSQRKKLYLACFKAGQNNVLGITLARAASTVGVQHEVRWNVTEPKGGLTSTTEGATPILNVSTNTVPSTTSSSGALPTIDSIPEPPVIPPAVEQVIENFAGEPSFASLGLGGWTPVGIVQNCLEYLHISYDLPWWGAIMIGTVVVRVLMFPLVIMAQRNAAKMSNNMPQLQTLQLKMTEARQSGNQIEAARYGQEMSLFMREKKLNPLKNVLVPLAQAPLFFSFFMGLRQMANVPVDSMRTGGLFWFTDLTVPDQYYLMPIITSVTMWITIEVGADGAKLNAGNLQTMRYILRALPVVILPFTINFPGAILVYWCSTNFISLLQVGFLRIPAVREFFKIEKLVTHNPDTLPIKPKGFVKGVKESWTNMKITRELEERQRFDEIQFERAGRGPIQKTYKHDPTKPRTIADSNAIAAKKR